MNGLGGVLELRALAGVDGELRFRRDQAELRQPRLHG